MFLKGKVQLEYLIFSGEQLKNKTKNSQTKFYDITIEKVVELSNEEMQSITNNFLKENEIIKSTEHTHKPILEGHANGVLFKEVGSKKGYFVVKEMNGSAGNTAYIEDIDKLEAFGENMIKALIVEPKVSPYYGYVENDLKGLQKAVSAVLPCKTETQCVSSEFFPMPEGYIEVIYPLDDKGGLFICNENSKLEGRELNRPLTHYEKTVDVIAGTFIVVADDNGEDFTSLNEEQIDYYKEQFDLVKNQKQMNEFILKVSKLMNGKDMEANAEFESDFEQDFNM